MVRRIALVCLAALLTWMASPGLSAADAPATSATAPATTRKAESQATPRDLVAKFAAGLQGGDKDKVVSCIDQSTDTGKKVAEAMGWVMDDLVVAKYLQEAAEAKFGRDAVKNAGFDIVMRRPFADEKELAKAQYEEDGDRATVILGGEGPILTLVKRDGKWFLDADEMMKDNALGDPGAVKAMSAKMAEARKECGAVLKDCKTIEEFLEKSNAIMAKAILSIAAPH